MIDTTAHNDLSDEFEQLPVLYSRRSDDGVQTWRVEVETGKHRCHSGIQGGAIVTSEWTTCKGKRGKTNEKQAEDEAKALHKKKLEKDYRLNVDEIDKPNYFSPMLANEYGKRKKVVLAEFYAKRKVFAQPKLDGMRCIATPHGLFSRNGKPIHSAPHIHAAVRRVFSGLTGKPGDYVLDGELYNHELKGDFDKLMSLARKGSPSEAELEESKAKLQYHVYDFPSFEADFAKRTAALRYTLDDGFSGPSSLVYVETIQVFNESEVDSAFDRWYKDGYEGAMIRKDVAYENKRTDALLKFKNFVDAEFVIRDILEGEGNKRGMAGAMAFNAPNGEPFTAALMGNATIFKTYLAEKSKYIGKKATVKFQNYTPGGIPRFPCVKAIREDE